METLISPLLTIPLISLLFFSHTTAAQSPENTTRWCNQTPHPETCKYFLNQRQNQSSSFDHIAEFRNILVRIALDQALTAQQQVNQIGQNCQNRRESAVWTDCNKLHSDTIHQLNRTLQGLTNNSNCTTFDFQTWLSTALTNIATCHSCSSDLNVSDFITPIKSNNLSEAISNTLAINGILLSLQNKTKSDENEVFPSWFSGGERRLLESTAALTTAADVVVAQDGSGNYRTVQEAINAAAKKKGAARFIIRVKRGVYKEIVEVGINNNNVWLVGDGPRYTIITGSRSVKGGYTTYSSATAGIDGTGFVARGITFINSAGPSKGQAVALRSASDLSIFYNCAFHGYQDTLFVHSQRQFYRSCYIYGTIDFIFGNAAVVFQNCMIYVRRPLKGQSNMITAQGRNDPYQNTGISIQNSQILPAFDLKPVVSRFHTYLGRPWMQYSRTVILNTYIDSFIHPEGWSKWLNTNFGLNTLYYGEYKNKGPGSSTAKRVKWKGYHVITSSQVASSFTVNSLIAGQSWLPATGIPFTPGL